MSFPVLRASPACRGPGPSLLPACGVEEPGAASGLQFFRCPHSCVFPGLRRVQRVCPAVCALAVVGSGLLD